jgi:uncharacterized membrane protein
VAPPSFNYNTISSIDIEAGESINLTVRVATRDSPLCPATTFHLEPNTPPGWDAVLQPTLFLAPEQTCYLEFMITAPKGTESGTYRLSVNVTGISADETPDDPNVLLHRYKQIILYLI